MQRCNPGYNFCAIRIQPPGGYTGHDNFWVRLQQAPVDSN